MTRMKLLACWFGAALVLTANANDVITVERSRARSGVGPEYVEKAEKALEKHDYQSASRDAEVAIHNDPDYWPAFYTRAKLFYHDRKFQSAIQDCNELLRHDSTFIPAALLRAKCNSVLGNFAAALKEFDDVITINPPLQYLAMAYADRAWFRINCPSGAFRNPQQAIRDATVACKIRSWGLADPIDTLACAYAAIGDFAAAQRYEQQAMQAPDAGEMSQTLQAHLALFKQRRALR